MWRTLHFILLVFIVLAVACIPPLPPPGQIPPPPDAGPPDVFTLFTADCSLQIVADQEADQEKRQLTTVRDCLGASFQTNDCLVAATKSLERDTIVCALVDLNVGLQRKVAMGAASPDERGEAARANTWIRDHRVGVRN